MIPTAIAQIILSGTSGPILVANGFYQFDRTNDGLLVPPQGVAFPTTNVLSGELFYRTDQDALYARNQANTAWVQLSTPPGTFVPTSRQIISGAGMVGGGDLSADRTLDVIANADGSIIVNPNDVQVGIINDSQHGNRGGGLQHVLAVASGISGFLSGVDKQKLDDLITDAVPETRTLTAGISLAGGGDLSTDRVFDLQVETFEASEAAGGTPLVGLTTLPFDTVNVNNAGGNYTYVDPALTVGAAGLYEIGYSVGIDKVAGGARQTSIGGIFVNGVAVPRSVDFGYHRNVANGEDTLRNTIRESLPASASITVRANVLSGPGTLVQLGGNQSKFWLKRIG